MLEKLIEYISENYQNNVTDRIKTIYKEDKLVCFFIVIDSQLLLSQITFWNDLSCMQEIFLIKEERYLIHKRDDFENHEQLVNQFNSFIDTLEKFQKL